MATTRRRTEHSRLPPLTEHTVDCTGPAMVWQGIWRQGAQRLGYCRSCGAVAATQNTGGQQSPSEPTQQRKVDQ